MAKVIFLIIFLIILLSLFKQFFRCFFNSKLMSSTSLFRGQMTNFGRIRNRLKRINDNFFLKKISCIFFKNFSDASETFFIYFLQHVSYASEIFSLIFFHLFLTQSEFIYFIHLFSSKFLWRVKNIIFIYFLQSVSDASEIFLINFLWNFFWRVRNFSHLLSSKLFLTYPKFFSKGVSF